MTQSPIAGYSTSDGRELDAQIAELQLSGRAGRRTWLAHTADGTRVAAIRLFPQSGALTDDGRRVIDRATALVSVRSPRLVPLLGVTSTQNAVWLVSEWDDGVTLSRLLQVAGVTPEQVTLLAGDLLSTLATLHAAGCDPRITTDDVRVDRDGGVRLAGWALAGLDSEEAVTLGDRAVESLAAVLTELASAARRSWPGTEWHARIVEQLDTAAEQLRMPFADVAGIEAAVTTAIGETRALEARAELASLAAAVSGNGSPRPAKAPTLSRESSVSGSAGSGRTRTVVRGATRSLSRWVVALVVLALAAGVELIFLRGHIVHDLHQLAGDHPKTHRPSTPAHSARAAPLAVTAPAPAAAGTVSVVDIRALQPCAPRSSCAIRVVVSVRPRTRPVIVRWTFEVVDRCKGARRSAPGGSVVLPRGAASTDAVGRIRLPAGRALAVIAVTTRPARAASAPLLVPSGSRSC